MAKEPDISKLIVVGDRVLIKPKTLAVKSSGGLYLPPGYKEKEEVQSGYIVKTGPGYPIPVPADDIEEPWKISEEKIRYMPLQAKVGDLAIFLQKGAVEIMFHGEKYFIVPQYSILLLERDDEMFN
jgi:co-chaperonin GroES (HSP10)